jgi:hypothetical protein
MAAAHAVQDPLTGGCDVPSGNTNQCIIVQMSSHDTPGWRSDEPCVSICWEGGKVADTDCEVSRFSSERFRLAGHLILSRLIVSLQVSVI